MKNSHRLSPWMLLAVLAVSLLASPQPRAETPAELLQQDCLFEVVRHLYRWYMDETDIERVVSKKDFVFLVRGLSPELDANDQSKLGQIVLPALGFSVTVKKPDYTIPELGTTIKSDTFKITAVDRISDPNPKDFYEVRVEFEALLDYLFRTRSQVEFPDETLMMRLRLAVRKNLEAAYQEEGKPIPTEKQIVHISPLSPVANELWVFWETGRRLIHFSSDIELSDPAVWDHEELAAKVYDIDKQVVLSLNEAATSNAYLTRYQVGRALYNCIILGKRLELNPQDVEDKTSRP